MNVGLFSNAIGAAFVAQSAISPAAPSPASILPPAGQASHSAYVEVVRLSELERLAAVWDDLAANSLEPNVFYESWLLTSAARATASAAEADDTFLFTFVMRADAGGQVRAIGFFPWQRRKAFRRWPVRILQAWDDSLTFLSTPLVRADHAHEAWQAILTWAASREAAADLIEFPRLVTDGPVHHALIDVLYAQNGLSYSVDSYTRPMLTTKAANGATYMERVISAYSRRKLRQKRNNLQKLGTLSVRKLEADADIANWIDTFLKMEAEGWKGREGTAMLVAGQDAYFRTICREAFERGRLHMLALFLDDRPISMLCGFVAKEGEYLFKLAYDEAHARYSPGALLQLDNIDEWHGRQNIAWQDSCATPKTTMLYQLWGERRVIGHVLIATGSRYGRILTGVFPLLKAVKSIVKRRTTEPSPASRPEN